MKECPLSVVQLWIYKYSTRMHTFIQSSLRESSELQFIDIVVPIELKRGQAKQPSPI